MGALKALHGGSFSTVTLVNLAEFKKEISNQDNLKKKKKNHRINWHIENMLFIVSFQSMIFLKR